MKMRLLGQRVRIAFGYGPDDPFKDRTGTIIGVEHYTRYEPPYYRVRLDDPVYVEGVGSVKDDLWQGQCLRTVR